MQPSTNNLRGSITISNSEQTDDNTASGRPSLGITRVSSSSDEMNTVLTHPQSEHGEPNTVVPSQITFPLFSCLNRIRSSLPERLTVCGLDIPFLGKKEPDIQDILQPLNKLEDRAELLVHEAELVTTQTQQVARHLTANSIKLINKGIDKGMSAAAAFSIQDEINFLGMLPTTKRTYHPKNNEEWTTDSDTSTDGAESDNNLEPNEASAISQALISPKPKACQAWAVDIKTGQHYQLQLFSNQTVEAYPLTTEQLALPSIQAYCEDCRCQTEELIIIKSRPSDYDLKDNLESESKAGIEGETEVEVELLLKKTLLNKANVCILDMS